MSGFGGVRLAQAPANTVIYAVGDVHGRRDLLEGALAEIRAAARRAAETGGRTVAVFIGDYIDRGPDSRGVIESLIQFSESGVCETVILRGNHEQVLLDIVDGVEQGLRWLDFGGAETLAAYGVAEPLAGDRRSPGWLRALVAAAIPSPHLAFLRATTLAAAYGDYTFVHAGLRPERTADEQAPADLLWFRYYDDETPVHGRTVVHGHSTNPAPVLGRYRIGIDTEAYASGALTVLRLEGDGKQLLRVAAEEPGGPVRVAPWAAVDSHYRDPPAEPGARQPASSTQAARGVSYRGARRRPEIRPMMAVAGAVVLLGAAAGFALLWDRGRPQAAPDADLAVSPPAASLALGARP